MAFAVMCVASGIRLIARFLWDGTIFYDRIAVGYTQALASFSIFYIFAYVFREKKPPRVVTFLSEISFEIYLYHYMFIVGPLKLFGTTFNFGTDCLVISVMTIIIVYTMNRIFRFLLKQQ